MYLENLLISDIHIHVSDTSVEHGYFNKNEVSQQHWSDIYWYPTLMEELELTCFTLQTELCSLFLVDAKLACGYCAKVMMVGLNDVQACDIKDPKQNIEWTVPEGGGGPGYSVM